MKDLVVLNGNKVPTTTSLKVAEIFGKRHKDVMDAIKIIIHTLKSNKIDGPNFRPITL